MTVRPRALVHRGSVEAAGLLVDPTRIGVDEARRRVLDIWSPGTRTWHLRGNLATVWTGGDRRLNADEAPGALLVRCGRVLAALPLRAQELAGINPSPGSVVLACGGDILCEPLGEEVDPATWIDLGEVTLERGASLTDAVAQSIRVLDPASAQRVEEALRARVGDAVAQRDDVVRAVAKAQQGGRPGVRGDEPSLSAGLGLLASVLSLLLGGFLRRTGSRRASPSGDGGTRGLAVRRAAPPSPAGTLTRRLSRALNHLVAQTLLRLRLARFVGRWQAEYLAKMMDLFERGELEDALRYAIPLGGEGGPDAQPAILPPRPRENLALTAKDATPAPAIGLVGDLYAELGRRYRAAFARLDKLGDVERAAFVLAELLRATMEAVAYLEKHRRFALAAELAEARQLPAEYAVRLWFRAGERRRAIALARRQACFALAVERLEREDPTAATALRLAWADACASEGDYIAAAQIARGVASADGLVAQWIELAIEVGGVAAARASILKLERDPNSFEETRARLRAALDDTAPFAESVRQAFYGALAASAAPGAKVLARAAVRVALSDTRLTPRSRLEELVSRAADPALRLHALGAPTLQRPTLPPAPGELAPIVHLRQASDGDGLPVHDCALVAHDRLIVALGELGVRMLSLDGRILARFDVPASSLVVSSKGDRVLAVTRRDGALEVARIDVVRRRAQRWGVLAADAFAPTFDGATWFIARGDQILALDATLDDFDATWRGAMMGCGTTTCLYARNGWLLAIGESAGEPEGLVVEAFELPSITLRHRRAIPNIVRGLGEVHRAPEGCVYRELQRPFEGGAQLFVEAEPLRDEQIGLEEGFWCARGRRPDGSTVVRSGSRSAGLVVETSTYVSGEQVGLRLGGHILVMFGRRGQLLALDVSTGALVTELVVRV